MSKLKDVKLEDIYKELEDIEFELRYFNIVEGEDNNRLLKAYTDAIGKMSEARYRIIQLMG